MTRRQVLTVNLKDDPAVIAAYRRYHREVWPEVQDSLRRHGVERMDIYLRGRQLVMVVEMAEGLDYRAAFAAHAASSARVIEWERLMASMQEPPPGARPDEWWAAMEPVFHMEPEEPAIAHLADRTRPS